MVNTLTMMRNGRCGRHRRRCILFKHQLYNIKLEPPYTIKDQLYTNIVCIYVSFCLEVD
jgi:hypothetical protein